MSTTPRTGQTEREMEAAICSSPLYTPGPWKADGYRVRQSGQCGTRKIADVCYTGPQHTPPIEYPKSCRIADEANARLIAAAPQMLDALEAADECLAMIEDTGHGAMMDNVTVARRIVLDAISSANVSDDRQPPAVRKEILLRAAYDLLKIASQDHYVREATSIVTRFDDANCDGYRLMEDIAAELGLDDDEQPIPLGPENE
jgi:hypothetical protein